MTTFSLKKYGAIALSILGLAFLISCEKGGNLVLEECTPPIDNFQFLSIDGDIAGQAMIRMADGGYLLAISDSDLGRGFELHWLARIFRSEDPGDLRTPYSSS